MNNLKKSKELTLEHRNIHGLLKQIEFPHQCEDVPRKSSLIYSHSQLDTLLSMLSVSIIMIIMKIFRQARLLSIHSIISRNANKHLLIYSN